MAGEITPSDETANWQTYRNEELEFEFKYPNRYKPSKQFPENLFEANGLNLAVNITISLDGYLYRDYSAAKEYIYDSSKNTWFKRNIGETQKQGDAVPDVLIIKGRDWYGYEFKSTGFKGSYYNEETVPYSEEIVAIPNKNLDKMIEISLIAEGNTTENPFPESINQILSTFKFIK